jgi:hypothetical protein
LDIRFYLTAVGQTSGFQAQNTFTDNKNVTVAFAVSLPVWSMPVSAMPVMPGLTLPLQLPAKEWDRVAQRE